MPILKVKLVLCTDAINKTGGYINFTIKILSYPMMLNNEQTV